MSKYRGFALFWGLRDTSSALLDCMVASKLKLDTDNLVNISGVSPILLSSLLGVAVHGCLAV